MARPIIPVDEVLLEKLAAMFCTMKEMAAVLNVSVDTLERRYAEVIAKGREKGRSKLRRLQWQSAERGNVAMLIFLGKQLLHQRDVAIIEGEVTVNNVSGMTKEEAMKRLNERTRPVQQVIDVTPDGSDDTK